MNRRQLFQAVRTEVGGGNIEQVCHWVNKRAKTDFKPSDFRDYFSSRADSPEIENACKNIVSVQKIKNTVQLFERAFTVQETRKVKEALRILKRKGLEVTVWGI